jgi:hypothetical protein
MSRLAQRHRGTAFSWPTITLAETNPLIQGGL